MRFKALTEEFATLYYILMPKKLKSLNDRNVRYDASFLWLKLGFVKEVMYSSAKCTRHCMLWRVFCIGCNNTTH